MKTKNLFNNTEKQVSKKTTIVHKQKENDIPVSSSIGTFIMASEANLTTYLECNGAEYSKEGYPELVELWENLYGEAEWFQGSDDTKFRVPDHNTAGLFMRGSMDNLYEQGDITESSTKAPNNDFFISETHTHQVYPQVPSFKPHKHRIGNNIWVNEEGGLYSHTGGTIPLNSKGNSYTEREILEIEGFTPIVTEQEVQINSMQGGDFESAPAAFVTKIWVLARTKFSLPPDAQVVNSINGMSGNVTLKGPNIPNNVYLVNNKSPDENSNVDINSLDINALTTVNGVSVVDSQDIELQKEQIDSILYTINDQTGEVYLGYREDIDQQVNEFNNGVIYDNRDDNNKIPSEFLLRLRNNSMEPVSIETETSYALDMSLSGIEEVVNTWNIRDRFDINGSIIKFPTLNAEIFYLIDIRLRLEFLGSGSSRSLPISLYVNGSDSAIESVPIARYGSSDDNAFSSILFDTFTYGENDPFSIDGVNLKIDNKTGGGVVLSTFDILIKGSFATWL